MKVKVALRFRGREMQHTEFGFDVVNKFLQEIASFGRPDFEPKLLGRSINVMVSPLPRSKRAKNPQTEKQGSLPSRDDGSSGQGLSPRQTDPNPRPQSGPFNNPFGNLDVDPSSNGQM